MNSVYESAMQIVPAPVAFNLHALTLVISICISAYGFLRNMKREREINRHFAAMRGNGHGPERAAMASAPTMLHPDDCIIITIPSTQPYLYKYTTPEGAEILSGDFEALRKCAHDGNYSGYWLLFAGVVLCGMNFAIEIMFTGNFPAQ